VIALRRILAVLIAIRGITNLRGKILPVLDLRKRLGLPPASLSKASRIVVTDLDGKLLGLLVDAVHQVLQLPTSRIDPPPEESSLAGGELLGGVAQLQDGRLLLLLELQRLLGPTTQERRLS